MIDIDPRLVQLGTLRNEGQHAEALRLLQQYTAAAAADSVSPPAPSRFIVMLEWTFLTEVYASARDALRTICDGHIARLLAGDLYLPPDERTARQDDAMPWRPTRFSLIVEMNEILGDARSTYDLFARLEAEQPALARRYAWQALPAIVEAGDFAMADRYRGDPLRLLQEVNQAALTLPLFPPNRKAPRLAADLMNLTRSVRIGIAVLHGLGRAAEADGLRAALLAGLALDGVRALAQRELDAPGTILRELTAHQMAQEDRAPAAP